MNFAPDLATVTHGIQLAVAPVFSVRRGLFFTGTGRSLVTASGATAA